LDGLDVLLDVGAERREGQRDLGRELVAGVADDDRVGIRHRLHSLVDAGREERAAFRRGRTHGALARADTDGDAGTLVLAEARLAGLADVGVAGARLPLEPGRRAHFEGAGVGAAGHARHADDLRLVA